MYDGYDDYDGHGDYDDDYDDDDVTPSSNTRSYTLLSIPSSPGWSFLLHILHITTTARQQKHTETNESLVKYKEIEN